VYFVSNPVALMASVMPCQGCDRYAYLFFHVRNDSLTSYASFPCINEYLNLAIKASISHEQCVLSRKLKERFFIESGTALLVIPGFC
jgi:hypothetical protein